ILLASQGVFQPCQRATNRAVADNGPSDACGFVPRRPRASVQIPEWIFNPLWTISAATSTAVQRWLRPGKRRQFHVHFTPTSSSWLRKVERLDSSPFAWFAQELSTASQKLENATCR